MSSIKIAPAPAITRVLILQRPEITTPRVDRHCGYRIESGTGFDPQSIEILATKYKGLPGPKESSATAWDLTAKSGLVRSGQWIADQARNDRNSLK